jgi:hypothetical protein
MSDTAGGIVGTEPGDDRLFILSQTKTDASPPRKGQWIRLRRKQWVIENEGRSIFLG